MAMSEAHTKAYEYLGRMDAEFGQSQHPGADLFPAFEDGQLWYSNGFAREKMTNRRRPRSLAQMHADMMARTALEKSVQNYRNNPHPLTRTPKKYKPEVDDW